MAKIELELYDHDPSGTSLAGGAQPEPAHGPARRIAIAEQPIRFRG